MGDKYLDWLFKYSNLNNNAKFLYNLFLGFVGLIVFIAFIWIAPNSNAIWIGIKVVGIVIIILAVLLFKLDISKYVSYLCFKPCTIKYDYKEKASEAVGLFIASLLFLIEPLLLTWAYGVEGTVFCEVAIFLLLYGLFRLNIRQYLT